MLQHNNVNINEFIKLTNAGMKVATFTQIREALIDRYKQVYGKDIDLSTGTADGIYVNDLSLIINNILQSINIMYANLDVDTASGVYLDTLCALSNVTRKQATNSIAYLNVTYTGNVSQEILAQDLVFIDKSGLEWVADASYTFVPNNTYNVKVVCEKEGAIEAPAGWITQALDASYPFIISQPTAADVGNEIESDSSLKARREQSSGAAGTTVTGSLAGALLNMSGIRDAKIYNNNTGSPVTLSDGSTVSAHSIYVVVRLDEGVEVSDESIGTLIYEKLTPGITSCECIDTTYGIPKSYQYIAEVAGIHQVIEDQYAYWKQAKPINPQITLSIAPYSYFSTDEFDKIAKSIIAYMNDLLLNESVSVENLTIQAIYADPMFKSRATYAVQTITVNSTNNYTYYNYSSWFVKCSGTVTGNGTTISITNGVFTLDNKQFEVYNNFIRNANDNTEKYAIVDNTFTYSNIAYHVNISSYTKTNNNYDIYIV